MPDYMGKDGFIWWQGVVEDRKDPLYLGRCKVRILGWHTDNKSDITYAGQPVSSQILKTTTRTDKKEFTKEKMLKLL